MLRYMHPALHCITRTGLLSQSMGGRCTARHEGKLDTLVREKGASRGTYLRRGATGQTPGADLSPPVEFTVADCRQHCLMQCRRFF